MADLTIDCVDVQPERYGTSPTLIFKLRITEKSATPIHAIALRVQIRIEPQRRRYDPRESELLTYLFGDPSRWADTLKPLQFTTVSAMVPSFTGSTEIDVPVTCTYDLEVAAGKYFHALDEGIVPFVLLFSGTAFSKGEKGFWVDQVPWHLESSYRMPIEVWKQLMNLYFPNETWVRLRHDTVDALLRYKAKHAIPTWDAAMEKLLVQAGEASP
jgi:hypothetical protein